MSGQRGTRAQGAEPEPEPVAPPSEHDRELLDYLIERAWQEWIRHLPHGPTNDNEKKRAA